VSQVQAGVVRLAEIRSTVLSVDEVLAAVEGPAIGGTVVFLGTVRDHDQARAVVTLEYSAHPSAQAELERVVADVARSAPGVSLAALHRVGELSIGDVAVVVAAGAAHRGEAFDAGRTLIDRIKAEVPLWKHQRYADGEGEWVGSCE
jgi:molybdopterin synthase catalytic subunit